MKIWHNINMNKIDEVEHKRRVLFFFIHELIKKGIATLVAGGNINGNSKNEQYLP